MQSLLPLVLLTSACVASGSVRVEAQSVEPSSEPATGSLRFVYLQFDGAPGLLVKSVEPGGAAGRAGIARGDCIMAIGGRPLVPDTNVHAFYRFFAVGQHVSVDIVRDGRPLTVEAVLDPPPPVTWRAPGWPTPVFTTSPVCMKPAR